jgi:hypothetical protein
MATRLLASELCAYAELNRVTEHYLNHWYAHEELKRAS